MDETGWSRLSVQLIHEEIDRNGAVLERLKNHHNTAVRTRNGRMHMTECDGLTEVKAVIRAFSEKGITCFLSENPLLELSIRGDIDLVVECNLSNVIPTLLALGWSLEKDWRARTYRLYAIKFVGRCKVKLDISRGIRLFSGPYTYAFRLKYKIVEVEGVPFLSADDYFHVQLSKIHLKAPNAAAASFRRLSESLLAAPAIAERAVTEHNYIEQAEVALRRYFHKERVMPSYMGRLQAVFKERRLLPVSAPKVVAFVGVDGAGKGTYIPGVEARLESANMSVRRVYLGHSQFRLPALRLLHSMHEELQRSQSRRLALLLVRVLYMCLFPLDLLLRGGRGRCDVIIEDRHPAFERFDERRRIFAFYNRVVELMCPSPSLVILLTGDDTVLWERKRELPFPLYVEKKRLLEQQVQCFKAAEVAVIRTDKGKDIVLTEIDKVVSEHVFRR